MRHRFATLPVALLALLLTVDGRRRGVPRHDPAPERLAPRGHHRRPRQHRLRRPRRERRHRQGQRPTGAVDAGFVDPVGKPTVGIDFDFRRTASGPPATPTRCGCTAPDQALLQTYAFTSGFINDVAVTWDAVYATDSNMQQLLVIPLGKRGQPRAVRRVRAPDHR